MRRTLVALALGTLAVVSLPVTHAVAQDTRTARGTVTSMAADSVTVKVQNQDMKFSIDGKTIVEAVGAGTKARQAEAVGKPGPKLSDVLKVGQAVEVSYHDVGGTLHAARIKGIASAGETDASAAKVSSGTVKSVAANSMTITGGGGGGATFTQTFSIDANTKVVGKGAGTAAAAKGGKVMVTDLVGNGDRVSVSYHVMGNTLHASEIRVTTKAGVAK